MMRLLVLLLLLKCILSLNIFSIKSTKKSSSSIYELKQRLVTLTKNTNNGVNANKELRTSIDSVVSELERLNPTKSLSNTKLLDGNWKLLYTTNIGSSAGKLGPFVGKVNQIIDFDAKQYVNTVNIGNVIVASLNATWNKKSDKAWEVIFQSLKFELFGIKVKESELTAIGIWRKSYIDQNLRILYAKGGKNVEKENIYILYKDE